MFDYLKNQFNLLETFSNQTTLFSNACTVYHLTIRVLPSLFCPVGVSSTTGLRNSREMCPKKVYENVHRVSLFSFSHPVRISVSLPARIWKTLSTYACMIHILLRTQLKHLYLYHLLYFYRNSFNT